MTYEKASAKQRIAIAYLRMTRRDDCLIFFPNIGSIVRKTMFMCHVPGTSSGVEIATSLETGEPVCTA